MKLFLDLPPFVPFAEPLAPALGAAARIVLVAPVASVKIAEAMPVATPVSATKVKPPPKSSPRATRTVRRVA